LVRRRTSQLERRWYQRISRYQGSSSGTIDLVQCASTLPASAFDTAQHSDAYIYNYQNLSKNFTNTKTCSASGGSAQTSVIWGVAAQPHTRCSSTVPTVDIKSRPPNNVPPGFLLHKDCQNLAEYHLPVAMSQETNHRNTISTTIFEYIVRTYISR